MISRNNINLKAPNLPGIYFLYSKKKKLVYIGRANATIGIKKRLRQHNSLFEKTKIYLKNRRMFKPHIESCKPFEYFRFTVIFDKVIVDICETILIKELNPPYNNHHVLWRLER